jgi:hypothetical protein
MALERRDHNRLSATKNEAPDHAGAPLPRCRMPPLDRRREGASPARGHWCAPSQGSLDEASRLRSLIEG